MLAGIVKNPSDAYLSGYLDNTKEIPNIRLTFPAPANESFHLSTRLLPIVICKALLQRVLRHLQSIFTYEGRLLSCSAARRVRIWPRVTARSGSAFSAS